jgi:hypothetical protein
MRTAVLYRVLHKCIQLYCTECYTNAYGCIAQSVTEMHTAVLYRVLHKCVHLYCSECYINAYNCIVQSVT